MWLVKMFCCCKLTLLLIFFVAFSIISEALGCGRNQIEHKGKCYPTCPVSCGHGRCLKDNSCVCDRGYALGKDHKHCFPVCQQGCNHGTCTAPNVCTCDPGYKHGPNKKCQPHCNGCANGVCKAPNVCDCFDGYQRKDEKCIPVCPGHCPPGKCVAPGHCMQPTNAPTKHPATRHPATKHPPTKATKAPPTHSPSTHKCDQICINGACTGPNHCTCKFGYALDAHDNFKCTAHCQGGCVNGNCVSPDICACNPGYVNSKSDLCVPECPPGHTYILEQGGCVGQCDSPCENGICMGSNQCQCKDGYTLDSGNKFRCITIPAPQCDNCLHGTCIGPNQCECHPGFNKVNNVCLSVELTSEIDKIFDPNYNVYKPEEGYDPNLDIRMGEE